MYAEPRAVTLDNPFSAPTYRDPRAGPIYEQLQSANDSRYSPFPVPAAGHMMGGQLRESAGGHPVYDRSLHTGTPMWSPETAENMGRVTLRSRDMSHVTAPVRPEAPQYVP